jgi:hypothetical protein
VIIELKVEIKMKLVYAIAPFNVNAMNVICASLVHLQYIYIDFATSISVEEAVWYSR